MILNSRIITTMVMLAIFSGMSLMALGYPDKARFLPLLVGVPGTLMCLAQLIFDVRGALQDRSAEDSTEAALEHPREVKMFLWLALFLLGIMSFGFLLAAPVLVFAFLRFGEKEPWVTAILGGLGSWIILYGVFTRLLELFLFEGFLTRLLVG
jgi:hypothetical protein